MHIQAPLTFFAHGDQHHAPVQVTGLSEHNRLYEEEETGRQSMLGMRLAAALYLSFRVVDGFLSEVA